jgi:S-adenosylmethionine decarboxylase
VRTARRPSSLRRRGKAENQGFDAFLPLIDSGISLYIWSSARFFSAILYTCRRFDEAAAIDFTRRYFRPWRDGFARF